MMSTVSSSMISDLWPNCPARRRAEQVVRHIQDSICDGVLSLEKDGVKFVEDVWQREDASQGGGITRVLQNGNVMEKAGVNVSVLSCVLPPSAMQAMTAHHETLTELFERANGADVKFFAAGVSVVLHGHNPFVPTMHCNYRYFEVEDVNSCSPAISWVGGGTDLTPAYLFEEDCVLFHRAQKEACDEFDPSFYPHFKKWCDEYFFLKHRQECRGVGELIVFQKNIHQSLKKFTRTFSVSYFSTLFLGGIFFDDLSTLPSDTAFNFIARCGAAVNDAYLPIVKRRMHMPFTAEHKEWQQIRRGRYVEFNLIWDRGTSFGLRTPHARIESILMSLPLTARWEYMNIPADDTPEHQLVQVLKKPRDWLK